ncbi:hypothetical protein IWW45_009240, partial [Coemansia sp. RSA 485]
ENRRNMPKKRQSASSGNISLRHTSTSTSTLISTPAPAHDPPQSAAALLPALSPASLPTAQLL